MCSFGVCVSVCDIDVYYAGGLLGRSWEEFGRQKGSPRTPFGRPIFMFFCYKNVGFYTISVIWEVWGNGRVPLCLPLIFDVFLGRVFRKS